VAATSDKMLAVKQVSSDDIARLRSVIAKLHRRLRQTNASAGLTPTQLSVLFHVVSCDSIGVGELAKSEGLNPTLLSRTIAHLVERGLLKRKTDANDRRAALVEATAAGRKLRDRARSERNDALARFLAAASADDRRLLVDALPALERLADGMGVRP
jgi:DNA-binding MarR family transcriptional regulator